MEGLNDGKSSDRHPIMKTCRRSSYRDEFPKEKLNKILHINKKKIPEMQTSYTILPFPL